MNIKEKAEKRAKGYIDECCYREFPDNFVNGYIAAYKDIMEDLGKVSDALIALKHYGKEWNNWEECVNVALTKLKELGEIE